MGLDVGVGVGVNKRVDSNESTLLSFKSPLFNRLVHPLALPVTLLCL